ncbi:hypothetical protein FGU71_13895 [Erythrobacter insulae]|uniref:Uncharacterized protein n=1 Tax=Erythrobacter insulae TaxID=2584124 RepID=A0A547P7H9_9SPHN|nr:hypothetical protein [Erythrobacter insulae]TRD10079.1 hypothetical protein FGU71_13895 [Erythrobacter insulae]
MDMENLLQRYFGTTDLGQVQVDAIPMATDRMLVDFGLESDRGKRFALWSLLHILDAAPDLDVAFEDEADREAARNFMDMMASTQ